MTTKCSIPKICSLLILFAGMFTFGLTSCDNNGNLPVETELSTGVSILHFSPEGGSQTIEINSNKLWFAERFDGENWTNTRWYSLSDTTGKGRNIITITVAPADTDTKKGANDSLIIRSSSEGRVITIYQSGTPLMTTNAAANIDEASAILSGSWIYGGEISRFVEAGIAIKTAAANNYSYLAQPTFALGNFTVSATELNPATDYVFTVYVKEQDGTYIYGDERSFTTLPAPQLIPVATLRAYANGSIAASTKIEGVVISDTTSSNIPGNNYFIIVDKNKPTEQNNGIAVTFSNMENRFPLNTGDVVTIKTTVGVLSTVSGMRVLTVDAEKVVKSGTTAVNPVTVAYTDLAKYESMLVSIENTQLAPLFADQVKYPNWNSAPLFDMEIDGSENTYNLSVKTTATFANDATKNGSGTLVGIVGMNNTTPVIYPRKVADIALSNPRFPSLLVFKMVDVTFAGAMEVDVENANCGLTVSYKYAEANTQLPNIRVDISGDGAKGLSVNDLNDYTITNAGNGTITMNVTGTPVDEGTVTFKVVGLEEYGLSGSAATCTATVTPPSSAFTLVWNPVASSSGSNGPCSGDVKEDYSFNFNPAASNTFGIIASATTVTGFANGGNWASTYAGGAIQCGNSTSNMVSYTTSSLTIPANLTVNVKSLSASMRLNNTGGQRIGYIVYRINGGSFQISTSTVDLGNSANYHMQTTFDLSTDPGLQNIAGGSTLEIRIVPVADTYLSSGTSVAWTLSNGGGGNVPLTVKGTFVE